MFYLACPSPPDPLTFECAEGWEVLEVSAGLLPPMSVSDAFAVGGAIVLLWVIAYGVRVMIHLFHGRYN